MKLFIFSITLMASAVAFANGQAGDVFFTKSIKKQVCVETAKAVRAVSQKSCEKARFTFAKDKVRVTMEGVKKPLTTQMEFSFEADGVELEAVVNATLEVTPKGAIKRTGWVVMSVSPKGFSDEAILKTTWHGPNVSIVEADTIPKKVLAKMVNYVEEAVNTTLDNEGSVEISSVDDAELGEVDEWEAVYHPETGKVVGYVGGTSAASESLDSNMSLSFKFDAKGNIFDEYVEGRGYWE